MLRDSITLASNWGFQIDPQNGGDAAGYWRSDYDASRWREVSVPLSLERGHPDLEWYVGTGWYRRVFQVPQSWMGRAIWLRFEAVNYHARIWVNNQLVGQNEDGFLPFEIPIDRAVSFGRDNTLVVRADNEPRAGEAPGMNVGWRPFGGILREVTLEARPRLWIRNVKVDAEPRAGGSGAFSLTAWVRNDGEAEREVTLAAAVLDARGLRMAEASSEKTVVPPGGEVTVRVEGEVANALPWSPASPTLYTAQADLRSGDEEIDRVETRFGFRRVEARDARILLNGEPIKLWGYNRHEDSPNTGACTDLETVRRDLLEMKAMSCNFVRLCHYPHHPGEVALCDEVGLLVMDEIPVYGSTGMAEDEAGWGRKMEAARRQLKTMIERDWNHPSVIFWSVSNETHDQHPFVTESNDRQMSFAKRLDPTRLVTRVTDHWSHRLGERGNQLHFEVDDVICLNDYPWMLDMGYAEPARLPEQSQWWAEGLARVHELYPDKPILVSEFGFQGFEGVYDNPAGEDREAAVIEANLAGMTADYVCGAAIWVFADHASAMGFRRDQPARLTIGTYGTLTRGRKPKRMVYDAVRRLFAERQREQSG